MPWEAHWIPAPKDETLPVLAEPPAGNWGWKSEFDIRRAYGHGTRHYFCPACNGWIEGNPAGYAVELHDPDRTTATTETFCRRCGGSFGSAAYSEPPDESSPP
jgi:hypothetical protein